MYKEKTFLGIIPARGGSKRIPGKNIKALGGKPLINWTIESAKRSVFLDRICVTTDDNKISEIASAMGADVPIMRPAELAKDESSTVDCVIHLMSWIQNKEAKKYDYLVLLQATSPFRRADHIDAAIKKIVDDRRTDSLISYCRVEADPVLLAEKDMSGFVKTMSDKLSSREMWKRNGAIYISRWEDILKYRSFDKVKTYLFEMDEYSSIDLDTDRDWKYAEFILKEGFLK
jgi:N-acylneuraminate cytidylyltransferase/CMP-N,N'-diacetyllegionaminic acid synthase